MTQCAVSLNLADQFKYAENNPREIICDSETSEKGKKILRKYELTKTTQPPSYFYN